MVYVPEENYNLLWVNNESVRGLACSHRIQLWDCGENVGGQCVGQTTWNGRTKTNGLFHDHPPECIGEGVRFVVDAVGSR